MDDAGQAIERAPAQARAAAGAQSRPLTVISQYPLSRSYAAEIERRFATKARFLTLVWLRSLGVKGMLQELFASTGTVAVGLEDPTSAGALPILRLLASGSRARRLLVLDHQLAARPFNRPAQAVELARLAAASLDGQRALRRSHRAARRLCAEPRIDARVPAGTRGVAYLNANLWFGQKAGGSVGHISGVANGLMLHGYGLDYFSVGGRLSIREQATVHELSPPQTFALPYETNMYRFDHAFEAQAAPRIDPGRASFLYQRLSLGNFSGVRISRAKRLPLVVEYNGSEVWVAQNWSKGVRYPKPALAAEEAMLRHAHVVVTISDVLRDELLERGVEPDRIVSYPNCVDPELFDPARYSDEDRRTLRAREGIPADACVATFVGTFGMWHGAEVYAEAIAALCRTRPDAVHAAKLRFLFVGDGMTMPRVREVLDSPECRALVRFHGVAPQAEAPAFLAASDILVSPHVPNRDGSRFFGSPTKLFEYMAMGKAIVASDLDQIGQVLSNSLRPGQPADAAAARERGSLSLLLPPGNAGALADGLLQLATDVELRAALGANARREALARYTWEQHVAAILDRLQAVAG